MEAKNSVLSLYLKALNSYMDFLSFRRAVNLYPYRKCLGTREIIKEEDEMQPNGRVFKKLVCGEYSWLTYAEVDVRARAFGKGLAALGQQVRENIVIFSETKADWMIAAQGCFAQNFPRRCFIYFFLHFLAFELNIQN